MTEKTFTPTDDQNKFSGKDLISMGFKPAPWFKLAIEHINANSLSGDEMLAYITSVIPPPAPPTIPLHIEPVKYHVNITAETDIEKDNLEKAHETMSALCRVPVVVNGAIMPDVCPAGPIGTIPVGGVAVTKNSIVPGFHSADICCSLMLTNLGKVDPKSVLDAAQSITHFGPGGRSRETQFILPTDILEAIENNSFLNSEKSVRMAREHLGTQGDGNHFCYIGTSKKTGDTVIVTHHGSRGFGAFLYKNGMKVAEEFRKKLSPETPSMNAWIPFDTAEGQSYWEALQIVRKWTKQNHMCIHDKVCEILGISVKDRFWNEHNFVFKDGDLFYHAKGATPVDTKFLQDLGGSQIIPLNMVESILIVEGGTNETNLGFAPHGAGRNYSRTQHKLSQGDKTVDDMFADETKGVDARFFSGKIDISELPSAYKNAEEVKRQIKKFNLATIVDEIIPYGSLMAGEGEEAPWRRK
jgi:RNA-splicing ligase RtcB